MENIVNLILPVHNGANTLRRLLNSLESQTSRSFRLVCMDDTSSDESVSILKESPLFHKNVLIIIESPKVRNPHPGGFPVYREILSWSVQRFEGVFCMLDQEDFLSKNFVEVMVRECPPADIIIPGFYEVSLKNNGLRKIRLYSELMAIPSKNRLKALLTYPEFWGVSYLWHATLTLKVVKEYVLPFFKIFIDDFEKTGVRHMASDNVLSYILIGEDKFNFAHLDSASYFKGVRDIMSSSRRISTENRVASLMIGHAPIEETRKSLSYLEIYGYKTPEAVKLLNQIILSRHEHAGLLRGAWSPG